MKHAETALWLPTMHRLTTEGWGSGGGAPRCCVAGDGGPSLRVSLLDRLSVGSASQPRCCLHHASQKDRGHILHGAPLRSLTAGGAGGVSGSDSSSDRPPSCILSRRCPAGDSTESPSSIEEEKHHHHHVTGHRRRRNVQKQFHYVSSDDSSLL